MRVVSIISLTIAAAIFTYLIGATLGSPVQYSDDVTTVLPVDDIQNDEVAATTSVSFSDEPEVMTGESVTQRARQDGEDEEDDDDDDATSAPVSSTRAPVPPPRANESTILTEFNFVAQPVDVPKPVAVEAVVPAQNPDSTDVDEEDDPDSPAEQVTQAPAQEQPKSAVQESQVEGEDVDSDNEITQDEAAGTTFKPSTTFESEYKYTLENFNKIKNRNNEGQSDEEFTTTFSPSGNYSDDNFVEQWEHSAQYLFDGEGRAGCECGKLPFKIPVNEKSGLNPSPWMAAIVRGGLFAGGRPHCAGTLINNLYVLTSASCMNGLYPTQAQVWLTAHDSFDHHEASFGNIKVNIQEILMHPNYDRRTKENDLCLIKLSSAVDISSTSYFVPACLPGGNYNFAGTMGAVTGWSQNRANRVCRGDMPILDNGVCNRDTRHKDKIKNTMVCAGYLTPTRVENCIGDAGGPLVSPNNGRSTLVGVVSFGYEAKSTDYTPTVFTRVSEFGDWLLHNTREADWCGI